MLNFKMGSEQDADLLFLWVNDQSTRDNSYHREPVEYSTHVGWYTMKINSGACFFYIFYNEQNEPVGQVRIEKDKKQKEAVISISVDLNHRGKGYSIEMLQKATADFLSKHDEYRVIAYIFKRNQVSYNSFLKAGYKIMGEEIVHDVPSYVLYEKL